MMESLLVRVVLVVLFWVYSLIMGSVSLSLGGGADAIESFPRAVDPACEMHLYSVPMQRWALKLTTPDEDAEAYADCRLQLPRRTLAMSCSSTDRTCRDVHRTHMTQVHQPFN